MEYNDEERLIESLKQGEEKAFVYILENYNKPLFAYALTLTNDESMAQDILQNVFLKIWEQRERIIFKRSILNYLFKSVYNEFINHYKKNKSFLLLEQKYYNSLDKVVLEKDNTFFENAIEYVTLEIKNLPPKCKEVFLLSKKEGLTNIEIAEYLNTSIKSVEAHMTKAYNLLRERVGSKLNTILFLLFRQNPIVVHSPLLHPF